MKKRYRGTAVLLAGVMLLAGCSSQNVPESSQAAQETSAEPEITSEQEKLGRIQPSAYNNVNGLNLEPGYYISVLGRSESGAYWDEVQAGMDQAIEDINTALGYEGGDRVRATYNAAAVSDDVDEQVNILDEELARYPVAVGIALSDANACEVQFDLAAENGIPVVAFDSGSDYQGLMATVGTDNDASAREAAGKMAEELGESGEVLILVDNSKAKADTVRESAFRDEIQNQYPGITIAGSCYMDQWADAGEETDPVQEILTQYPNITGIFATSSDAVLMALEVADAMGDEDVGAEAPVIMGYDAEEEEVSALEDGRISGLIVQNPYGMGYATIVAAARAALAQGNEAVVNTGYLWVDAENMDSDEAQRLLY